MGEADIAVRHLTRSHADAVVRAYVREAPAEAAGWTESVLTSLERRLDKALLVTIGGHERLLHLEIQWDWRAEVAWRVWEYQALLAMASMDERGRVLPIQSVVVLLTGDRRQRRKTGDFKLSWPGRPFAGARFRIDRIYRQRVSDLIARGDPFWLAMAPLTRDASGPTLDRAIARTREIVQDERELGDILTTMTVLAEHGPCGAGLADHIRASVPRELIVQSSIYRMGQEEGREEVLDSIFSLRLERELTDAERETILRRIGTMGADRMVRAAVNAHDSDALAQWLAAPDDEVLGEG